MDNVKITFVGHSTTLIQSGKISILTDPMFSDNVLIIKRAQAPGIDPGKLPEISAVLISHGHMDHLDFASFNYIRTTVPIVIPEGMGKLITKHLPNPAIELAGWANHDFSGEFKVHAVPVNHNSAPFTPYRYKRAVGYIIELGGKKIFFAGDTAYSAGFRDIGKTYPIDVALLPIGAYKPQFFMKRYHMDPADAVQAFLDLNAKVMIPIHWGTFKLSLESLEEPVEWLQTLAKERGIEDKLKVLKPGDSFQI